MDLKNSNPISISVIIPCYNSESTISRCLESIFFQTELPDEIILIDDNSKDKTLSEIELLKKKSPIKFKTLKNNEIKVLDIVEIKDGKLQNHPILLF